MCGILGSLYNNMLEIVYKSVLSCRPALVYGARGAAALAQKSLREAFPDIHLETCVNEKTAYEAALAGAWVSKRVACIFSAEGVYEALDPLMSSAYTGVKGGFVVVCIKQTDLDVTPLGPFSKLPLLTSDGTPDNLASTLRFAFDLSERHEIPCLVETPAPSQEETVPAGTAGNGRNKAEFVKDTGRWAPTPKFRFQLHKVLNEKIERIRDEFESYKGNAQTTGGTNGIITHRAINDAHDGASVLTLATVFPLPTKLVAAFIEKMDTVEIREGAYPAIEMQVAQKNGVSGRLSRELAAHRSQQAPAGQETMFGLTVVRDTLGPASSINIAHGMVSSGARNNVLAITDDEAFFHSGLPAFVNTLYNGSSYVLVINTKAGRTADITRCMEGVGFSGYAMIENAAEIERFKTQGRPVVLLFGGRL